MQRSICKGAATDVGQGPPDSKRRRNPERHPISCYQALDRVSTTKMGALWAHSPLRAPTELTSNTYVTRCPKSSAEGGSRTRKGRSPGDFEF